MIVDQYSAQQVLALLDQLVEGREDDPDFLPNILYQLSVSCKMPPVFEWIKKHLNAFLLANSLSSKTIVLKCISIILGNSDNVSRETRLDYLLAVTDKVMRTKEAAIKCLCSGIICTLIDILYLDAKATWTRYKEVIGCVGIGRRVGSELSNRYNAHIQQHQVDVDFELDQIEREVLDYAMTNNACSILSVIPIHFYSPVEVKISDSVEYVSFASKVLEQEMQGMPRPVLLGTGNAIVKQPKRADLTKQHPFTFATLCAWSNDAAINDKEAKTRFDAFIKNPISILQLPWFLRPTLPIVLDKFINSLTVATAETQWMVDILDKIASSSPSLTAYAIYALNAISNANIAVLQSSTNYRDRTLSLVSDSTNEEILVAGMHALGAEFAKKCINQGGVYKSMYAGYCIGTAMEQQDGTLDERSYFGYCYARWVHGKSGTPLHQSSNDPLIIQSNCLLTGHPPATPINEPIDTKYAIALCTAHGDDASRTTRITWTSRHLPSSA